MWEDPGNILFVDSDMVVVDVALDGNRSPWDIGSWACLRVSQMCSGYTTWGVLDEGGMIGLIVLSLINSVVDWMYVVMMKLEIVVVDHPGTTW